METDYIIGLDNGTSSEGLGILTPDGKATMVKLPIKKELSYTKEPHKISRIDVPILRGLLKDLQLPITTKIFIERPFVNPKAFRASLSAIRALEAELILIEEFGFFIHYVDSKEWQSSLLPKVEGRDQLKAASLALGQKLYPNLKFKSDADSILIAHWAKYKGVSVKKKEL